MFRVRNAYARYFNTKYKRKGQLGERNYFLLEVEGLYHMQAALDYVNRQGLHHGLASSPFGYKHCSANSFFRKELGKQQVPNLIASSKRSRFLPSNNRVPERYRMSPSGLLFREDILDTAYVEEIYITPRNFLFHMNRLSNEEREIQEQKSENDKPPITLNVIERDVPDFDPNMTKTYEQGKINFQWMSDVELCQLIDNKILPEMSGNPDASIYSLTKTQRTKLYDWLWQKNLISLSRKKEPWLNGRTFTEAQLCRCLCMKYVSAE